MTRKHGTRIVIHPATSQRWPDLVTLFGPRGACGGCWCMTPRLSRSEYQRNKGEGNKRALKQLVESDTPPGILAYIGGQAVGWCAIEPRSAFSALDRSRILKPVDDQPVWSIVCMFVAKDRRQQGVSRALIRGAVAHARRRGAKIVEGYPIEPKNDAVPDVFAWTGLASAYRKEGFREVARRSVTRPIMRKVLRQIRRPVSP